MIVPSIDPIEGVDHAIKDHSEEETAQWADDLLARVPYTLVKRSIGRSSEDEDQPVEFTKAHVFGGIIRVWADTRSSISSVGTPRVYEYRFKQAKPLTDDALDAVIRGVEVNIQGTIVTLQTEEAIILVHI